MQRNPVSVVQPQLRGGVQFLRKVPGRKDHRHGALRGLADAPERAAGVWSQKVMHARLTFGDVMRMGSDPPPGHQEVMKGLQVNVCDPAEADRVFQALAENGADADPEDLLGYPFADRSVGTPWMVNCEQPAAYGAAVGELAVR